MVVYYIGTIIFCLKYNGQQKIIDQRLNHVPNTFLKVPITSNFCTLEMFVQLCYININILIPNQKVQYVNSTYILLINL